MTDDTRRDTSDEALAVTHHHGRTGQRHGIALGEGQIRRIFPLFVLAMWATAGAWVAQGAWTTTLTVLAAEALVVCLLAFVNFVWVFNVGYGGCAVLLNATVLLLVGTGPAALVVGGLLVAYGVRLVWFSLARARHASFAARAAGQRAAHRALPAPVKVLLWLQPATLFTFAAMTTYVLARDDTGVTPVVGLGAVLLLVGLVVESVADAQKQRAKRSGAPGLVTTGLWSRSRHPNYLGEILVQVGVLVCAVGAALETGWGTTFLAMALAPAYIVLLMVSATTGAELAREQKHGDDAEVVSYVARTGSLLPRLTSPR